MSEIKTSEDIEMLVQKLTLDFLNQLKALDLPSVECRRDHDGVSELSWLIQKMVGEKLSDQYQDWEIYNGLVIMDEDWDPTPLCAGCGAMLVKQCKCGPLADND